MKLEFDGIDNLSEILSPYYLPNRNVTIANVIATSIRVHLGKKDDLNKKIKEKLEATKNKDSWFPKNIIYEPMKKSLDAEIQLVYILYYNGVVMHMTKNIKILDNKVVYTDKVNFPNLKI